MSRATFLLVILKVLLGEGLKFAHQVPRLVPEGSGTCGGLVHLCNFAVQLLDLHLHVVDHLIHQVPQAGEGARQLLLHLVAAVGTGEVDDEAQLARGVLHVLPLKGALLGAVGPREPLEEIDHSVQAQSDCNHLPAHRTDHKSSNGKCSHGGL
uniref:Putative secreted protein n=1 Tax=Ixodes ricinus TaxID=34613 RepID=A0A6B0UX50_IXORI